MLLAPPLFVKKLSVGDVIRVRERIIHDFPGRLQDPV
jgi:hypothetical protein